MGPRSNSLGGSRIIDSQLFRRSCPTSLLFYLFFAIMASTTSAQANLPNLSIAPVAGASTTGVPSGASSTSFTLSSTDSGNTAAASSTTTTSTSNVMPTNTVIVISTSSELYTLIASSAVTGLLNAPTLAGVGAPPLIIPDTSGAPFMQRSNLPEGTVFICVGAALGFFGMSILAWRGLIAWSLQRSVNRAAHTRYTSETKAVHRSGHVKMCETPYENVSLEHLTIQHKASRLTSASRTPKASSLFFSPTAGAGGGIHTASNHSTLFSQGLYPSGPAVHIAGATAIYPGMPLAAGYSRSSGDNLSMGAQAMERDSRMVDSERQAGVARTRARESNLTLGFQPQGRTPSAYMDDLLENHGNNMKIRD